MAGAALLSSGLAKPVAAIGDISREPQKAMLVDVTKCVGCWFCWAACKQANGFRETRKPDYEDPPDLAPDLWSTLFITKKDGDIRARKHACMHCTDAACVKVCPTGALSCNALGFVQYEKDKCSGCGYCTQFCPFEIPRLETESLTGKGRMDKCTFCATAQNNRVPNGQPTACAEACPTGAIKFGERVQLLQEGRQRAEELRKTNPAVTFYGDAELGGLHVMYVLDDSPEVYGLPPDPQLPPPAVAHEYLQWIGIGATAAAIGGFSLNYLVARMRIAKQEEIE